MEACVTIVLPLLRAFPGYLLATLSESAAVIGFGLEEEVFQADARVSELHYLLSGQIGATRLRPREEDDLVDVLLPVQPLCLRSFSNCQHTSGPIPRGSSSYCQRAVLGEMMSNEPRLARPFFEYARGNPMNRLWRPHSLSRIIYSA
jgi:hypothetical protein